ncbi:MAG TPA: flagellar protein FliT [Gammaproteobacteria bacterium]|nr:flagellar protein FliT [Gammaproteobacteria bacterium]
MSPLVATVLDLTDQVQAAIDGGDWTRAQELETERRRLLEQLAAAPDAGDLKPTFAALVARNHRLVGLVEHQKRRVLREAAVARSGHDAAAAYADVRGSAASLAESA